MLHPGLERALVRERVSQMRAEVAHNRLEARLAGAPSLSEEARLAKARLGGAAARRGGMLNRGRTFVAAMFR